MREIRMPSLGAEMDEGTLLEWYVKPGDRVEYGDVIALLDTEKAEIEMESFAAGTVESLLIAPGDTVAVGVPIATLAESGATGAGAEPEATQKATAATATTSRAEAPPVEARTAISHKHVRATPLARRRASERGVDLTMLSGSGPGGAIIEADVPAGPGAPRSAAAPPSTTAAAPSTTAAAPSTTAAAPRPGEATSRMPADRAARRREIIAAAMQRSKREIPHYYLSTPIEIDAAIGWLETRNRDRAARDRLVLSALYMKAVARAAALFPEMNGLWLDDGFHPRASVDLGMVVSLRSGGIVVPTFRDVHRRSVEELMGDLSDVVGRARAGRLRSSELGEASITVTSLGDDGAETIFGVVYPPQVAIVGFGGIRHELHVEGDLHGTRRVVTTSLSADHRASDGQRGSRFLLSIGEHLRDPERL